MLKSPDQQFLIPKVPHRPYRRQYDLFSRTVASLNLETEQYLRRGPGFALWKVFLRDIKAPFLESKKMRTGICAYKLKQLCKSRLGDTSPMHLSLN